MAFSQGALECYEHMNRVILRLTLMFSYTASGSVIDERDTIASAFEKESKG
jgi:hypothetical protein